MADIGQSSQGMAGEPQMGIVYDNTKAYSAQPKNTTQMNLQDPTGAGLQNNEGRIPTYGCATLTYAPYALASDILVIIGSATTLVRVRRIAVSGRATGSAQTAVPLDVGLYKRFTLNTGGNPTLLSTVLHDTVINPAATATVQVYTAPPTIAAGGPTPPILFRAQQASLLSTTSGGAGVPVEFDFGQMGGQSAVLRNANESLALSLGAVTVPAGTVLNLWLEWTEE